VRVDIIDRIIPHYLLGHGPMSIDQIVHVVKSLVPGALEYEVRNSMQRLTLLQLISTVPDGRWVAVQP